MISLRSIRPTLCVSAFLALGLAVAPRVGIADLEAWDQDRITRIAEEFSDAVNEVYRALARDRTGSSVGSGQAHAFLRVKDSVRVARNEARHLAQQLEEGKSREETELVYKRLMTLIRDARESGKRMFIEESTQTRIDAARDLLQKLTPYYEEAGTAAPTAR